MIFYTHTADQNHAYDDNDIYAWDDHQQQEQQEIESSDYNADDINQNWNVVDNINNDWVDVDDVNNH